MTHDLVLDFGEIVPDPRDAPVRPRRELRPIPDGKHALLLAVTDAPRRREERVAADHDLIHSDPGNPVEGGMRIEPQARTGARRSSGCAATASG